MEVTEVTEDAKLRLEIEQRFNDALMPMLEEYQYVDEGIIPASKLEPEVISYLVSQNAILPISPANAQYIINWSKFKSVEGMLLWLLWMRCPGIGTEDEKTLIQAALCRRSAAAIVEEKKKQKEMLQADIREFLIKNNRQDEPVYAGGLRTAFQSPIVGKVVPGQEKAALEWAEETGNTELLKLTVGKRAIGNFIDQGGVLPECLEVETLKDKITIRRDTRKKEK